MVDAVNAGTGGISSFKSNRNELIVVPLSVGSVIHELVRQDWVHSLTLSLAAESVVLAESAVTVRFKAVCEPSGVMGVLLPDPWVDAYEKDGIKRDRELVGPPAKKVNVVTRCRGLLKAYLFR